MEKSNQVTDNASAVALGMRNHLAWTSIDNLQVIKDSLTVRNTMPEWDGQMFVARKDSTQWFLANHEKGRVEFPAGLVNRLSGAIVASGRQVTQGPSGSTPTAASSSTASHGIFRVGGSTAGHGVMASNPSRFLTLTSGSDWMGSSNATKFIQNGYPPTSVMPPTSCATRLPGRRPR